VLKDLKRYRKMNHFAEANPEFFDAYFSAITQMAVDYFTVNELPKRQQEFSMIKRFRSTIRDFYAKGSGGTQHHSSFARSLYKTFPLCRFLWQCLKGGISFI